MAADSPLAAAVRLYGPAGPACAVGLAYGRSIDDLSALTLTGVGPLLVTTGKLWAGGMELAYSLRWSLDGAKPVVAEVVPFFAALDPWLVAPRSFNSQAQALLSHDAPVPRRPLEDVPAAIWDLAVGRLGLSLVLRALAAWWRVAEEVAGAPHPTPALAAAVVRLVGARAGFQKGCIPSPPGTDDASVAAAARFLNRHLRLAHDRPW